MYAPHAPSFRLLSIVQPLIFIDFCCDGIKMGGGAVSSSLHVFSCVSMETQCTFDMFLASTWKIRDGSLMWSNDLMYPFSCDFFKISPYAIE